MSIVRISQQTEDDCLPCCIAMVLDETRGTVLSWFEGRPYNEISGMIEVLTSKGYIVEEFETIGEAGALRRIVALVCPSQPEADGHAVVVDEDHYVVDPRSKTTAKKTLLDYALTGYTPQRVFVVTKKAL